MSKQYKVVVLFPPYKGGATVTHHGSKAYCTDRSHAMRIKYGWRTEVRYHGSKVLRANRPSDRRIKYRWRSILLKSLYTVP